MAVLLEKDINELRNRLTELEKTTGVSFKDDSFSDLNLIDEMLEYGKRPYYLPNLYYLIPSDPVDFHELLKIRKPKSFYDLVELIELHYSEHYDERLFLNHMKNSDGQPISMTYQIVSILEDDFVDNKEAELIAEDLSRFGYHGLREWEELLLESLDLNTYQRNQIRNIKSMISLEKAEEIALLMYQLAFYRFYKEEAFFDTIRGIEPYSSVGPFFYIDGKVIAHHTFLEKFHKNLWFFDDEISHLDLFESFHIDGDYGNYPRGRVIFDNFQKRFVVYLDKDLMKEDIKSSILKEYCLDIRKTIFKTDSHYRHDWL